MIRTLAIMAVAAITFSLSIAGPGFAKGGGDKAGTSASQDAGGSHESVQHSDINSGRDFGQHVKEMNDMFSGDHNPGKHHKGYSGVKD